MAVDMERSLARIEPSCMAVMPVMDIEAALTRRQRMVEFVQRVMVEGTDYGKIPGSNKDCLFKPGAEKLATLFGLYPEFDVVRSVEDWTGAEHDGEPLFYYLYRCRLIRNGCQVAAADGSCNSWESKYRYRKAARVCPKCGAETIIRGRAEYGGGWLCFRKSGGCGAKFPDGVTEIEGQDVGRKLNDEIADLLNTLQKMSQKRAMVAAVLLAVNASEFFTQDIEEFAAPVTVDTETGEVTPKAPAPAPAPAPSAPGELHNRGDLLNALQSARRDQADLTSAPAWRSWLVKHFEVTAATDLTDEQVRQALDLISKREVTE